MEFKSSDSERKVLFDRIQKKEMSWKSYILSLDDKRTAYIQSLRNKIVRLIVKIIKEEPSHDQSTKKGTMNREVYIKYTIPRVHDMSKPIILDFGSRSKTSNVDLTVVNYKSPCIVNNILKKLNERCDLKIKFTRHNLSQLFDINIYINSFILVKNGHLVVMDCKNRESIITQRMHSKYRLENNVKNPYTNIPFFDLIRLKNKLIKKDDCRAKNLTSILTYFADDAYHSEGAFLHVVLQIQNGKKVKGMSCDSYLDSCFDNLGMYKYFPQMTFSKYMSRIVRALKDIHELKPDPNVRKTMQTFIDYVNDMSYYKAETKTLKYSIGRLSNVFTIKNAKKYNFDYVFAADSKGFYIPSRELKKNISRKVFLQKTKHILEQIERYFLK